MEYLGKKLQAGQLAQGSPGSVCCERETRESTAQALRCDLGPGLTELGSTAEISGTFGRRASADFGDHRWQGAELLPLSCQARWAESGCLLLFPVPCKQRGTTNENKARCLRLEWVDGHTAPCCPLGM